MSEPALTDEDWPLRLPCATGHIIHGVFPIQHASYVVLWYGLACIAAFQGISSFRSASTAKVARAAAVTKTPGFATQTIYKQRLKQKISQSGDGGQMKVPKNE